MRSRLRAGRQAEHPASDLARIKSQPVARRLQIFLRRHRTHTQVARPSAARLGSCKHKSPAQGASAPDFRLGPSRLTRKPSGRSTVTKLRSCANERFPSRAQALGKLGTADSRAGRPGEHPASDLARIKSQPVPRPLPIFLRRNRSRAGHQAGAPPKPWASWSGEMLQCSTQGWGNSSAARFTRRPSGRAFPSGIACRETRGAPARACTRRNTPDLNLRGIAFRRNDGSLTQNRHPPLKTRRSRLRAGRQAEHSRLESRVARHAGLRPVHWSTRGSGPRLHTPENSDLNLYGIALRRYDRLVANHRHLLQETWRSRFTRRPAGRSIRRRLTL